MALRRLRWLLVVLVIGVIGSSSGDEPNLRDARVKLEPNLRDARVKLELVGNFVDPVEVVPRSGDDELYVATRPGLIYRVPDDGRQELFLDLTAVVDEGRSVRGAGGEAGLQGFNFSPDGDRMYVTYTARWEGQGDQSVTWTLDEFRVEDRAIAMSSRRTLLTVNKYRVHHNAGAVRFGPDGYLYTAIGDATPKGDSLNTGQDPSDLLGSILRIDPRPSGSRPYTIPPDNPFVANGRGAPEVWLYGVRNPWRFTFDSETGDLWVGDVGDLAQEEINLLPASEGAGRGANLGWKKVEGTLEHDEPPAVYTPPVLARTHIDGYCAVIAGFVYWGEAIPELRGSFVHTDHCKGAIEGMSVREGRVMFNRELGAELELPSTIGQDLDGELYVASIKGGVYRIAPA